MVLHAPSAAESVPLISVYAVTFAFTTGQVVAQRHRRNRRTTEKEEEEKDLETSNF